MKQYHLRLIELQEVVQPTFETLSKAVQDFDNSRFEGQHPNEDFIDPFQTTLHTSGFLSSKIA